MEDDLQALFEQAYGTQPPASQPGVLPSLPSLMDDRRTIEDLDPSLEESYLRRARQQIKLEDAEAAENPGGGGEHYGYSPGWDWGDAWDNPVTRAAGNTLLNTIDVIDTPGGMVRTALHTGDSGKVWDSIWDPSKRATGADLRHDLGFTNWNSDDPEQKTWGGAIGDFAGDMGMAMLTDPLMLASFGTVGTGKAVLKAGGQLAKEAALRSRLPLAEQAAAFTKAARGFEAAAGKKILNEAGDAYLPWAGKGMSLRDDFQGTAANFTERLARGEEGASVWIPGYGTTAPLQNKALNTVIGGVVDLPRTILSGALETAAPGVKSFLVTKPGQALMDAGTALANTPGASWIGSSLRTMGQFMSTPGYGMAAERGLYEAEKTAGKLKNLFEHEWGQVDDTFNRHKFTPEDRELVNGYAEQILDRRTGEVRKFLPDAESERVAAGQASLESVNKQFENQFGLWPAEKRAAGYAAARKMVELDNQLLTEMGNLGMYTPELGSQLLKGVDELKAQKGLYTARAAAAKAKLGPKALGLEDPALLAHLSAEGRAGRDRLREGMATEFGDLRTSNKADRTSYIDEKQIDAAMVVTDKIDEVLSRDLGLKGGAFYEKIAAVQRMQGDGTARGLTFTLPDGRHVIHAFERADFSTAVEEIGHIVRKVLPEKRLAPITEWMGKKHGIDLSGGWSDDVAARHTAKFGSDDVDQWDEAARAELKNATQAEEIYTKAFQHYLKTGQAPEGASGKLVGAFATMKKWLVEIWERVKDTLGFDELRMTKEVKQHFDELLGGTAGARGEGRGASGADVPPDPRLLRSLERKQAELEKGLAAADPAQRAALEQELAGVKQRLEQARMTPREKAALAEREALDLRERDRAAIQSQERNRAEAKLAKAQAAHEKALAKARAAGAAEADAKVLAQLREAEQELKALGKTHAEEKAQLLEQNEALRMRADKGARDAFDEKLQGVVHADGDLKGRPDYVKKMQMMREHTAAERSAAESVFRKLAAGEAVEPGLLNETLRTYGYARPDGTWKSHQGSLKRVVDAIEKGGELPTAAVIQMKKKYQLPEPDNAEAVALWKRMAGAADQDAALGISAGRFARILDEYRALPVSQRGAFIHGADAGEIAEASAGLSLLDVKRLAKAEGVPGTLGQVDHGNSFVGRTDASRYLSDGPDGKTARLEVWETDKNGKLVLVKDESFQRRQLDFIEKKRTAGARGEGRGASEGAAAAEVADGSAHIVLAAEHGNYFDALVVGRAFARMTENQTPFTRRQFEESLGRYAEAAGVSPAEALNVLTRDARERAEMLLRGETAGARGEGRGASEGESVAPPKLTEEPKPASEPPVPAAAAKPEPPPPAPREVELINTVLDKKAAAWWRDVEGDPATAAKRLQKALGVDEDEADDLVTAALEWKWAGGKPPVGKAKAKGDDTLGDKLWRTLNEPIDSVEEVERTADLVADTLGFPGQVARHEGVLKGKPASAVGDGLDGSYTTTTGEMGLRSRASGGHEWLHSLDQHLGRVNLGLAGPEAYPGRSPLLKNQMLTAQMDASGKLAAGKLRPELVAAYNDLQQAIREAKEWGLALKGLDAVDGSGAGNFQSTHEMFARAMELGLGRRAQFSDTLAARLKGARFPQGAEADAIGDAAERFLNTLKGYMRDTPDGPVFGLYQPAAKRAYVSDEHAKALKKVDWLDEEIGARTRLIERFKRKVAEMPNWSPLRASVEGKAALVGKAGRAGGAAGGTQRERGFVWQEGDLPAGASQALKRPAIEALLNPDAKEGARLATRIAGLLENGRDERAAREVARLKLAPDAEKQVLDGLRPAPMAGMPMSRAEAEAAFARGKGGTAATAGQDLGQLDIGVTDTLKAAAGGPEKLRKLVNDAQKEMKLFRSDPVEARIAYLQDGFYRDVKLHEARRNMDGAFNTIPARVIEGLKQQAARGAAYHELEALMQKSGKGSLENLLSPEQAAALKKGVLSPREVFKPGFTPHGMKRMDDWSPREKLADEFENVADDAAGDAGAAAAGKGAPSSASPLAPRPSPLESRYVPAGAAEKYEKMATNYWKLPETLQTMTAPLAWFSQNIWKPMNTYYILKFHIRNQLSDWFRMLQEGAMDLGTVGDYAQLLNPQRLKAHYSGGYKDMAGWRGARFDLGEKGVEAFGQQVVDGQTFLKALQDRGALGIGYEAKILLDASERTLATAGKADKSAYARTLKDGVKRIISFRDDANRISAIASRMRQGDSLEEAVFRAEEALFNYGRVSPAADWLRKTGVAPFVAWSARNIPAQMRFVMEKPGWAAAILRTMEMVKEGGLPEEALPEYMQHKFNIQTGVTVNERTGRKEIGVVSASGIIPFSDLTDAAGNPARFVRDTLAPWYKVIGEFSFDEKRDAGQVAGEFGMGLGGAPGAMVSKAMQAGETDRAGKEKDSVWNVILKGAIQPASVKVVDRDDAIQGAEKRAKAEMNRAKGQYAKRLGELEQQKVMFGEDAGTLAGLERTMQQARTEYGAQVREYERVVRALARAVRGSRVE